MQRKKVPAGHHRFGLARLVLVLALLFLVVALTAGWRAACSSPYWPPGARCCFCRGRKLFCEN